MSEYQYYEFQALDKRLTDDEMAYMHSLSSRVELTPTQAVFVYNFGNFRTNPEDVLAKYFDAMLYLANWGSRQLMFRFPKTAVDKEALTAYYIPDLIEISSDDDYVILNIAFMDSGPDDSWLEGQGELSKLIALRDDLIKGDYRALYLVWLKAAFEAIPLSDKTFNDDEEYDDYDEEDDDVDLNELEPPVPPNLKNLSTPLRQLVEFFEIDTDLIESAAEASSSQAEAHEPVEAWVRALPDEERIQFLVRAAKGEPNIGAHIMRRLRASSADKTQSLPEQKRRTLAELKAGAEMATERRAAEARRQAQVKKEAKMRSLIDKEPTLWKDAIALIEKKNANLYDEAVKILLDLRELAEYQKRLPDFFTKVTAISQKYPTLRALQSKMERAKLI